MLAAWRFLNSNFSKQFYNQLKITIMWVSKKKYNQLVQTNQLLLEKLKETTKQLEKTTAKLLEVISK